MEEVQYVHYSLPETREEKIIRRLEGIIDKKLQEQKMEKERRQKLWKEILKLQKKYFSKEGNIERIVVGDILVITKNGVVIDGNPIEVEENAEGGNTKIDVERILQKLEEIDEKDVVVI